VFFGHAAINYKVADCNSFKIAGGRQPISRIIIKDNAADEFCFRIFSHFMNIRQPIISGTFRHLTGYEVPVRFYFNQRTGASRPAGWLELISSFAS
jgi:hypothetical protein